MKVTCEGHQPDRRKGTAETSASNNKRAYSNRMNQVLVLQGGQK